MKKTLIKIEISTRTLPDTQHYFFLIATVNLIYKEYTQIRYDDQEKFR